MKYYIANKNFLVPQSFITDNGRKLVKIEKGERFMFVDGTCKYKNHVILCKSYEAITKNRVMLKNCLKMPYWVLNCHFTEIDYERNKEIFDEEINRTKGS